MALQAGKGDTKKEKPQRPKSDLHVNQHYLNTVWNDHKRKPSYAHQYSLPWVTYIKEVLQFDMQYLRPTFYLVSAHMSEPSWFAGHT